LIIRRLIVPAAAAALVIVVVPAYAQNAFPAPLPNQAASGGFPAPLPGQSGTANSSAFPPVNSSGAVAPVMGAPASGFGPPQQASPMGQQASEACMNEFTKLRGETEKHGKALQAAGKRKASPQEACKLFGGLTGSFLKMLKYVEGNAKRCGIPDQVPTQIRGEYSNVQKMQQKVCNMAEQQPRGPAGPSFADVLGSSTAAPEANTAAKKFGGTTFDTLNGNVLAR
jgi:hypothetical protein